MIYHVLPGDSLTGEFKETEISGETIVFREALISGPIEAENPDEFWDERARFILSEYGEDEIRFHETVADEIERLGSVGADDEVYLWFEYELFCSVHLWFCLARLAESGAAIYRVEPAHLEEKDRWLGFGKASSDDLQACFEARQRFDENDIKLGVDLWNAFRRKDGERLRELGKTGSERFPYLAEVCEAAAEIETRPRKALKEIIAAGGKDLSDIFPEFSKQQGVYGFGDTQVQSILDRI